MPPVSKSAGKAPRSAAREAHNKTLKKRLTFPSDYAKVYELSEDSRGLVAQLDRVFDYESKGRGFESRRAHQRKGSPCGSFFRWFEIHEDSKQRPVRSWGKALTTAGGGNLVSPFLSRNKRAPLWGVAQIEAAFRIPPGSLKRRLRKMPPFPYVSMVPSFLPQHAVTDEFTRLNMF